MALLRFGLVKWLDTLGQKIPFGGAQLAFPVVCRRVCFGLAVLNLLFRRCCDDFALVWLGLSGWIAFRQKLPFGCSSAVASLFVLAFSQVSLKFGLASVA